MRGPQLWIASPQFAGKPYEHTRVVTTPEEARVAVRQMADSGYDFIKLTVLLDADPLADIRHTTQIVGVALGGTWMERGALDRMVQDAAQRLGARD